MVCFFTSLRHQLRSGEGRNHLVPTTNMYSYDSHTWHIFRTNELNRKSGCGCSAPPHSPTLSFALSPVSLCGFVWALRPRNHLVPGSVVRFCTTDIFLSYVRHNFTICPGEVANVRQLGVGVRAVNRMLSKTGSHMLGTCARPHSVERTCPPRSACLHLGATTPEPFGSGPESGVAVRHVWFFVRKNICQNFFFFFL